MPDPDQSKIEQPSGAGCITRRHWSLVGSAALGTTFAMLLHKHPKFPSLIDAACLLVVTSLVCVRYIDIQYCKGETGDGKPATLADWRGYSLNLVLGSTCVWLGIRLAVPLFAK